MSPLKALFRILIALCVLMLAPSLSHGQGVPWYTIPLPIPNGFVDAATGNVHLVIPIGSAPQRNRDPLVANIVYDSTQYAYNYNVSGFTAIGPGFRTIAGTSHSGTATISVNPYGQSCPSGYPNGNVQIASSPSFVDIQGTTHTVVNSNLYTKQVNCYTTSGTPYGNGSDITSFFGVAADGSGYTFQVSNYTQLQVRSADGWLVYDNTGVNAFNWPKDTNGNYVQSAVAGMPDMLNRTPFQIGFYICGSASNTITVRASDGSTQTYTMTCTSESVSQIISGTQHAATERFLTGIVLPDGTSYSFTYDTGTTGTHLGGLLTLTLPTGGTVSFTQVPGIPSLAVGAINLPGRTASVTFGGGTWNLSYVQNSSNLQVTTTVLSPSRYDSVSNTNVNDKTVFTTVPYFSYNQTAQYYSGSSTLLRTVTTTYDSNGNFLPVTITTTLNDTGQSSSVSYQYFNLMRNYPTQKQETDFTGTIVRTTKTTYTGYYMKPASINVYAGAGTGSPVSRLFIPMTSTAPTIARTEFPA